MLFISFHLLVQWSYVRCVAWSLLCLQLIILLVIDYSDNKSLILKIFMLCYAILEMHENMELSNY